MVGQKRKDFFTGIPQFAKGQRESLSCATLLPLFTLGISILHLRRTNPETWCDVAQDFFRTQK